MVNTFKISLVSFLLVLIVSETLVLARSNRLLSASSGNLPVQEPHRELAATNAPKTTKATTTKAPTTTKATTTTTTTTTTTRAPSILINNNFKTTLVINKVSGQKLNPTSFKATLLVDGDNSRFRLDIPLVLSGFKIGTFSTSYDMQIGSLRFNISATIPIIKKSVGYCLPYEVSPYNISLSDEIPGWNAILNDTIASLVNSVSYPTYDKKNPQYELSLT